ncbi:nuclear transcription factor Y subunit A-1 [Phoenix dactylifera]|uniref:Nuclear transcription factor Y subunit n=1 Tax=Phoenix dactylifera TaxID=42345 RepID=A0A8B7C387_PHODC|nr:nuclear transcription factor Y subunit A-1 [Phoenix dactylifera]XP_008790792.1 nuclear transcription factor Y subunit A-1 [Phoenix dactylifera]XP_026660955.1 nuclear transcription factor Y subunit A-1 [Phoenix dactylifera]XP_038975580.1 nuclear transcription factor Y subunit A-1-like [Phoenix dactylifera]XP_038975581.1 nuclear transcription factor Y subunit A-1-like [Phoenix dactylifera]XP_038975583.1 nuclear transcription factor Y subunit A-1-like [Phoenix dactylifera]XP_038975584.1 nucle
MESRADGTNTVDANGQGTLPSTINAQPWWRGPGFGVMSPAMLPDSASKSASVNLPVGGAGNKGGQAQSHDRADGTGDVCKEMQNIGTQRDGSLGQEHQHLQPVSSAMPPMMPEYLAPHTQLELGQSIACPTYSYSDPYFSRIMAPYGTQALVHPQLLGMPYTRMPLPLEMAEEPVYVNAKQYHGILRRRQSRAKAELEKKVIKVRKPYLHESRHLHAMRRARGCGGRFLNTKKAEASASIANPENGGNAGASLPTQSASSSASQVLPSGCPGSNTNEIKRPVVQGICEAQAYANGNDGYQQQSGFQLSFHSKSGERVEEGDCSGQQRGGILVNRPPNRAVAIQ